jgi:hypothetical protein
LLSFEKLLNIIYQIFIESSMKYSLKKLIVPFFAIILVITCGQIQNVSAQLSGGAGSQAAGLESRVSGELSGKVGGGVFERLRSTSGTSTKARPSRKKSTSSAKSGKTTGRKTTTSKSNKSTAKKNTSVEVEDDYSDYDDSEILTYKSVGNLYTAEKLANEFSTNAAEKQLILEVFKVVKVAYEDEAAKKGKKNDVALAMTFFVATCVTVYNDVPEPSDQAFDNLYDALADALVEDPQFSTTNDRTKQEISESLVYISGLILGGYMNGKQNSDQNTVTVFRTLAGVSLLSLTKIDPGKMSFNKNGLYIKP